MFFFFFSIYFFGCFGSSLNHSGSLVLHAGSLLLHARSFLVAHRMCDVAQEKAMAPHSSTLAWKIPRTEEPDRMQFVGSRRVRHD